MRLPIAVSVVVVAATLATAAVAQSANFKISSRKGAMTLQGKYAGPLVEMGRGAMPYDAAVVQRNADFLAVLAQMPWDDFQPNTVGLPNTRAKDVILSEPDKFKQLSEELRANVQKVGAAARAGDQAAFKASALALGRTCNSCHERFTTYEYRFKLE
jgi:cytochrome c556